MPRARLFAAASAMGAAWPLGRGKKNTGQLQVASIMRCIRAHEKFGTLGATEWGGRLVRLVADVQGRVGECDISIRPPRAGKVPKLTVSGRRETRDISIFDDPADTVLLARTAAYLRDWFEPVLKAGRCCYSFRRSRKLTHQSAVGALCRWRKRHEGEELFVAECDIRKFFDNIRHDEILKALDRYAAELGNLDPAAREVVRAYLRCYRFGETDGVPCGIPQGGSLSPVLANMVMAQADEAVLRHSSEKMFYARYCDDMVIAATDESLCRRAMDAYFAALEQLHLPPHPIADFTYGTDYFESKSKGPFRWCAAEKGARGCAPWVSFLGSQVRYDGETRIRKESIEKHIRSLGQETAKAVREIQNNEQVIGYSEEVWRAWFARFRNRLIAKGVGYVTAKVEDCHLCWAGAFTRVTNCADTRKQMRRLDRVREGMLSKVWRMLPRSCGKKRRRYKGRPFSYYGFLEKAARPANMRPRRRRVLIPYSEL